MASYNSILRHVSMKDVKRNTLKLREQKNAEERHIQEAKCELRYKNSSEFCNWREETNLKESDWSSSSGSSPTNSSSQQFTYSIPNFQTDQPNTVTISGLGGVESVPSTVTVDFGFGEKGVVPAPTFDQLGMQGYAPPLGKGVMKRSDIDDELDKRLKKADELRQEILDIQDKFYKKWNKLTTDWEKNNTEPQSLKIYMRDPDSNRSELSSEEKKYLKSKEKHYGSYELAKREMEKKTDSLDKESNRLQFGQQINQQLDASQEFTQNVGADYMMNARVQDTSPTPAYYPTDQSTVPGMVWIDNPMSINGGHWEYDSSKTKVASVGLTQQEQEWLNGKQSLINKLKIAQKFGGPAVDFAQWAINWAKGDYTPIKRFSSQMQYDVLDQISKTLANRPGTSGAVQYHDYKTFTNNSTRLGLGRFTFDIGPNGVKVKDNFDVDRGGDSVGGALNWIPGLQADATKITDLGNRVGGGKAKIPIDVTIPWSEVSPQLQNRLDPTATIIPTGKRKREFVSGRVSESTWEKLKKHRVIN